MVFSNMFFYELLYESVCPSHSLTFPPFLTSIRHLFTSIYINEPGYRDNSCETRVRYSIGAHSLIRNHRTKWPGPVPNLALSLWGFLPSIIKISDIPYLKILCFTLRMPYEQKNPMPKLKKCIYIFLDFWEAIKQCKVRKKSYLDCGVSKKDEKGAWSLFLNTFWKIFKSEDFGFEICLKG